MSDETPKEQVVCTACHGTGIDPDSPGLHVCPTCQGSGLTDQADPEPPTPSPAMAAAKQHAVTADRLLDATPPQTADVALALAHATLALAIATIERA